MAHHTGIREKSNRRPATFVPRTISREEMTAAFLRNQELLTQGQREEMRGVPFRKISRMLPKYQPLQKMGPQPGVIPPFLTPGSSNLMLPPPAPSDQSAEAGPSNRLPPPPHHHRSPVSNEDEQLLQIDESHSSQFVEELDEQSQIEDESQSSQFGEESEQIDESQSSQFGAESVPDEELQSSPSQESQESQPSEQGEPNESSDESSDGEPNESSDESSDESVVDPAEALYVVKLHKNSQWYPVFRDDEGDGFNFICKNGTLTPASNVSRSLPFHEYARDINRIVTNPKLRKRDKNFINSAYKAYCSLNGLPPSNNII